MPHRDWSLAAPATLTRRVQRGLAATEAQNRANSCAGYSLLEIIVAMAIMSLAVSIVVPNAFGLVSRFERLSERRAALDSLGGCRLTAITSNQVITLTGRFGPEQADIPGAECFNLPTDWQAEFESALVFSPVGVCRGTRVTLIAPNGDPTSYDIERGTCTLLPVVT